MKFQLLPNYFKKIGLSIFLLTVWPSLVRGYIGGYNAAADSGAGHIGPLPEFTFLGIRFFSEPFFEITSILSIVGLIIYALSRDKVFDEFLRTLRLEAMHLTFLLSVILILSVIIFNWDPDMSARALLELQVIIFLITYKVKKLNAKPEALHTAYE